MSPSTESLDPLREQVNDLYWNSDDTVDEIVSRLGMSRKAVYSAVRPLPAGTGCIHCGEGVVFMRRSSRSSGLANCPSCGAEAPLQDTFGTSSPAQRLAQAAGGEARVVPVPEPQNRWEQIKEDLGAVSADRAAKIGGAAALGVAVGAAAVKAIKKRG